MECFRPTLEKYRWKMIFLFSGGVCQGYPTNSPRPLLTQSNTYTTEEALFLESTQKLSYF